MPADHKSPSGPSPPLNPPKFAGNLKYLRKQSKSLLRSYHDADPAAVLRMATALPRLRSLILPRPRTDQRVTLADAQFVLARELGLADWTALKQHVTKNEKQS